ncbi:MAG TPA: hypothetical protein VGJ21_04520 [Terracidiphilus sp.]|jgi:hypothetical protein
MEPGLRIRFWWHDTDVVEVNISASNGAFSGSAMAYIDQDDPQKAATILEGFPKTTSDTREIGFGTVDPLSAGGGVVMRFFCTDSAGHAAVELRLRDEESPVSNRWTRPGQTAHFFADVEASAIDDFVRELRAFDPYESGLAFLRFGSR